MPGSEHGTPSPAGTPRRQASHLQPDTPLGHYRTPQGEHGLGAGLTRLRTQQDASSKPLQQPFFAESPTGASRPSSAYEPALDVRVDARPLPDVAAGPRLAQVGCLACCCCYWRSALLTSCGAQAPTVPLLPLDRLKQLQL